ncbi:MAG: hypothetical protein JSV61_01775 [Anaerolineales bacterium]|nr:MAG: hypothetical protein JSV61_01775 [Anaerolineales bacterium]
MDTHVKVVAWLYIVLGVLGIVGAAVLFLIIAGSGLISGDDIAIQVTTLVGLVIGGVLVLTSIPGIVVGVGLIQFQPWARIFALVLGLLNLLAFPVGTLLGIYTIFILLDEATSKLFVRQAS